MVIWWARLWGHTYTEREGITFVDVELLKQLPTLAKLVAHIPTGHHLS